ncbi:MAG: hypothetical protein JSC189_000708 [Candidatus Tokpelaia sp. JSC189]|nr:MAG: hypothetical protein JSC189_000708 [Candidatus Tokpelaia sp. JSC189]
MHAIRIALANLDREILAAYHNIYGINIHWLLSADAKIFGSADNALHKTDGLLNHKKLERTIEAVCEGLG